MSSKYAELRIALIGKTGAGKSSVGNTILGKQENVFKSTSSSTSVTAKCQKETGEFEGQSLAVVDTPGLFDTKKDQKDVIKEITRCISFAAPGPHVFLVVIQAGRFTKEEQETVKILQKMFGEEAADYTVALFTRGDDLEKDGITIEKMIRANPALTGFIDQCGQRYHVLNNRKKDPSQVRELLEKINTMVQRNGGSCYTNKMFQEAERAIQEETAKLRRENPEMKPEEARKQAEENNSFNRDVFKVFLSTVAGAAGGAAAGPPGVAAGAVVGFTTGLLAVADKVCVIQ